MQAIIALGGDGTVLRGIQKYQHLGVPFYGLNHGNLGFLTSRARSPEETVRAVKNIANLRSISVPIFECKIQLWQGGTKEEERHHDGDKNNSHCNNRSASCQDTVKGKEIIMYFINDASAFRASSQAAKLGIEITSRNRTELVYCDGAVVFSPLGSTGYNKSLGGEPIPLESTSFGLRIAAPSSHGPFSASTQQQSIKGDGTVVITNLSPEHRPCHCGVDGQTIYNIERMEIRKVPLKTVTLLFNLQNTVTRRGARPNRRRAAPGLAKNCTPYTLFNSASS